MWRIRCADTHSAFQRGEKGESSCFESVTVVIRSVCPKTDRLSALYAYLGGDRVLAGHRNRELVISRSRDLGPADGRVPPPARGARYAEECRHRCRRARALRSLAAPSSGRRRHLRHHHRACSGEWCGLLRFGGDQGGDAKATHPGGTRGSGVGCGLASESVGGLVLRGFGLCGSCVYLVCPAPPGCKNLTPLFKLTAGVVVFSRCE